MASTRLQTTKTGKRYYEIRVNMGRSRSQLTTRWYVPDGWSQKAIDRELAKQAAEFERKCKAGEVQTIEEKRQAAAQEAAEAAKILTLKQYGEKVYMPSLTVRCSENTRSSFQNNLDKRIYPSLGATKMPEITPAQISALLLSIQAEGKAHSTVVKVYSILHSLFKMAYMGDMIERNPMDKVERPKPRKDEVKGREIEAYTADELRYIIECLEKEPLKWRVYSPWREISVTPPKKAYIWIPQRTARHVPSTLTRKSLPCSGSSGQSKPVKLSAALCSPRRTARNRCTPRVLPGISRSSQNGTTSRICTPTSYATASHL